MESINYNELFKSKYNNNEYISKYLAKMAVNIPIGFNLDSYNNKVLDNLYIKYKSYFDTMYRGIDDNIRLDEEQIKAILTDEDFSLIIAGAGTGKTTTMAAKVKYLVDIKKIDPEKILVMSFTRKATEELDKRIRLDFNIPVVVSTFHALGYMHIKSIFKNHKCSVVGDNEKNQIFLKYFKDNIFPNKQLLKELIEVFDQEEDIILGKFFKENYDKYPTYDQYFKELKISKIKEITDQGNYITTRLEHDYNQEVIYTIKGELVKSKGEAIIANFLFMHQIPYYYEKIYEELLNNHTPYHPDFTLNLNGENIYIEYFGLASSSDNELNRYRKNMKEKLSYHEKHKNKLIAITATKKEDIIKSLKSQLLSYSFELNRLTNEEVINKMLDRYTLSQIYSLRNLYYNCIDKIKSSVNRNSINLMVNGYLDSLSFTEKNIAIKQYKFITDFYRYYQNELFGNPNEYKFDFPDMIYYANKYIDNANDDNLDFKYLVIDEYQDISQDRYTLVNNIIKKNHSKIVAVGDDWQSIYAFSGSNISYIYNFQKYFTDAKILYISKTYRNSKELIDYSGKFIMKNPTQIRKELISDKSIKKPIVFKLFDDEIETLKKLILDIYRANPDYRILILARKNRQIDNLFNDKSLIDSIGTKVTYLGYEDINIDAMSIHKSKGLTFDEVIIIGLDRDFPITSRHNFWLTNLFISKTNKENYTYAEERRVFYVALTRTKNHVYLLTNKDIKERSPFLTELYNLIRDEKNKE